MGSKSAGRYKFPSTNQTSTKVFFPRSNRKKKKENEIEERRKGKREKKKGEFIHIITTLGFPISYVPRVPELMQGWIFNKPLYLRLTSHYHLLIRF
eukprot:33640_5